MLRKADYTTEESIHIYEFCINLMKLPFSEGNAEFYADDVSQFYALIALQYAVSENVEKTLEALENAREYAIIGARKSAGNDTEPLVNRLRYDSEKKPRNYKGNACNLRLDNLKRKEFDFIRENERFLEVERELERNAIK